MYLKLLSALPSSSSLFSVLSCFLIAPLLYPFPLFTLPLSIYQVYNLLSLDF